MNDILETKKNPDVLGFKTKRKNINFSIAYVVYVYVAKA